MEKRTSYQYEQLAEKWLKGAISETEKAEFMAWYAQADNEQPVEIPAAFAESEIMHRDRILQAIRKKTAFETVRRIPWLQRNWRAAAVIFAVLLTGTYLWSPYGKDKKTLTTISHSSQIDIAPGHDGAILTLANGNTIVLDSMANGVVANQNGTQVLLNNGQLAYNAYNAHEVSYNTMTTPKGRQFQVILPDGTKVLLNAASSLKYPTAFIGTARKVEITGEAYFEVAANAKMPFNVKINDQAAIEVLGTDFNVNAYADETSINTTLLKGSVRIINGINKTMLQPGEQAQLSSAGIIQLKKSPDIEKAIAWKNGLFNFKDADLPAVARQLERWYDIKIKYEGSTIPSFKLQGEIDRGLSLSDVLIALSEVGVKFRMEGRILIISQ